jgi:hypothetical protein
MPLTEREESLAKETIDTLNGRAKDIKRPVVVSHERMAALHAAARTSMTCHVNGVPVQLVEAEEAPAFRDAVALACKEDALPELPRCCECGGGTAKLESGDFICLRCKSVQASGEPKSNIVLASERAALSKHPRARKH